MTNHGDISKHFQAKFSNTSYPFKLTPDIINQLDLSQWVKIPVNLERINTKLLPFIIAIGEIFRFEIGIVQPEYRIADNYILSLKVKQTNNPDKSRNLIDEWPSLTGNQKVFWEGMGRAVLTKYLFQDNDFNIKNALIDENNYFVAIDPDKCFWEVTAKYHYFKDVKIITTNHCIYPLIPVRSLSGRIVFQIKDKKKCFLGDLHKDDYDNLPFLYHHYPSDWFFHLPQLNAYSTILSKDQRFLNEKHFATIKALTTSLIKNVLIDIHLSDDQDKLDTLSLIATQISKLTEICKQSDAFKEYLQKHGISAIKVVLYEIQQFIKFNQHYILDDNALQIDIEDAINDDVISQYTNLLMQFNLPELTQDQQLQLKQYAKQVQNLTDDSIIHARHFYQSQMMEYHAKLTN